MAIAVLVGVLPASASGQANPVVTICHAVPGDQFLQMIVPEGDPQIAIHEGHPGDVIQAGNVPCPTVPPPDDDADIPSPPVDDCPTCLPREAARTPGAGPGAGEGAEPTPVAAAAPSGGEGTGGGPPPSQAPAAAGAPLPQTGTPLAPLLALLTGFTLLALLARVPSRRLRRNPY